MAFENLRAEFDILLSELQARHELYMSLMQKLNELKAFGMPLPEDLVELEKRLEAEFAQERAAGKQAGID